MEQYDIPVKVRDAYHVYIGTYILDQVGQYLSKVHGPCKVCVVTDTNVAPLYYKTVEKSLLDAGYECLPFQMEAGEENKNLKTYMNLMERLATYHLTRSDLILALGGGVVGDLAGFAAATYSRGIGFVQVPTTLLSFVDSSVGGKTAVDLTGGKNLVGAFKQPLLVVCDVVTIKTLPQEYRDDGLGECIKYGVLKSPELMIRFDTALYKDSRCEARMSLSKEDRGEELCSLVSNCIKIKADYVVADEFDQGDRFFLNLGHTIGHGIEQCSNYSISHGHAVAAGMAIMTRAGEKMGITEPGTAERLCSILKKNDLPIGTAYSAKDLAEAALVDKKRRGGSISIVVPVTIGNCIRKIIPVEELEDIIQLGL